MSNYSKSTDFAIKDTLVSGNPAKVIKGADIDLEFSNISTAVATKADTNSPNFTGTATTVNAAVANTLSVGGVSTLGSITATGTFANTGAGSFTGALTVGGALAGAAASFSSSMSISGLTTVGQVALSGSVVASSSQMIIGNYGAVVRGSIYNDSSGIGFLNNGGGWAYRVPYGTSDGYITGNLNVSASATIAGSIATSGNVTAAGAITASGNITAFSDERLKTNWRPLQDNIVEKIATVKHGVYDRKDVRLTQVGVSAQSLLTIMPEAVVEDVETNMYSVSYGNAAMVICVELAKEIVNLKAEIATLKGK